MRSAFAQDNTEAVLLADASNAFNRINRNVCIRNIQHLCPEFSTTIVNTYRSLSRLFVGGETILSCEGTTQGDPLAMAMYALGTVPLIRRAASSKAVQAWYADDSTEASTLTKLHKWWKKSILLVKPECLDRAREIFQDSSIDIRSDGCRYLGAVLGSPTFCSAYVSDKVDEWCREVDVQAEFARTQPQAAFAAFGQGVRHKCSFVTRTVPNTADLLAPLEERICSKFIPAIINRVSPGDIERAMLALPCRGRRAGDRQPILPCLPVPGLRAYYQVSRAEDPPTRSVSRRRPGCHHHSKGRDCFPVPAPGEGSCCLGHCHLHQHRRAHPESCC